MPSEHVDHIKTGFWNFIHVQLSQLSKKFSRNSAFFMLRLDYNPTFLAQKCWNAKQMMTFYYLWAKQRKKSCSARLSMIFYYDRGAWYLWGFFLVTLKDCQTENLNLLDIMIPAGTQRWNDVVLTLMRRNDVASTSCAPLGMGLVCPTSILVQFYNCLVYQCKISVESKQSIT